ncbi:hypothetical protein ACHAWF_017427, partial [Thalassiosira exigua]
RRLLPPGSGRGQEARGSRGSSPQRPSQAPGGHALGHRAGQRHGPVGGEFNPYEFSRQQFVVMLMRAMRISHAPFPVSSFRGPAAPNPHLARTIAFEPFGPDFSSRNRRNLRTYVPNVDPPPPLQIPAPAAPIAICVVDTGYDLGHVDLPQLPIQNVTGWDTGNANLGVWDVDGHSHGTHCAGSIGAVGNTQGVVGVLPDPSKFRFHIAKGLSDSGSGSGASVLDAVDSCVDSGAKVISMSLGCDGCFSSATEDFYNEKYDQDVLIIAAAGNSGDARDHFPSGYNAVMSVASVAEGGGPGSDNYGILSGFSTRNDQTEIAGPGSAVRSTVPGDNFATFSGTSMATPHVAGVAALLWSHFPDCTNNQIRNAILHAAPGWDIFYGHCIVDAGATYDLLSERGCVGAGGAFPDTANGETLSDQAPGGEFPLQFGCTADEHCQEASPDPCTGDFACISRRTRASRAPRPWTAATAYPARSTLATPRGPSTTCASIRPWCARTDTCATESSSATTPPGTASRRRLPWSASWRPSAT